MRPQATFLISSVLILATPQPYQSTRKPPSSSETLSPTAPSGWNDFNKVSLLPLSYSLSRAQTKCHSPFETFHDARNKDSCVLRQASKSELCYNYLNATLFPLKNYKLGEDRDCIHLHICVCAPVPAQHLTRYRDSLHF